MTMFAIAAVVLSLGVLAAVLWPLWRDARALAVGGALALGLATFALYRVVGTPAALDPSARAQPATLEAALAELRAELQRNPNQPEGWRLLGRTLGAQGQVGEAAQAYAQAAKLLPDDPDLLVEAAQARLYASQDRKLDAQAIAWIRHALSLAPGHQRGTWLLGIWQRQEGLHAEAAETWTPLLAQVDAATATTLRAQIDEARKQAGLPPLPAQAPAPAVASAHAIEVHVALDPALAAKARENPNAVVFVIARMPGGPPMPVAVEKHAIGDLPLRVTLDDTDGPMPTQKLSALGEVEVLARWSASGDPMRQPGDVDTPAVRVALPASAPVQLVLGKSD